MLIGHGSDNDDGDKTTHNDQEKTNLIQCRQSSVGENDDGSTNPGDDEVGDIDVPWLDDEVLMKEGVHLYHDISWDGDD